MRVRKTAVPALVLLVLAGCGGGAPAGDERPPMGQPVMVEGGEYREIIVPELQAMLEDKDFPLINVHIPFAGDLPGTDASIPFNEIADHLDRLPEDKDATIVLYCRTGPMSSQAAEALVGLGYTDVYHLDGGFNAWAEWGLPMADGPANP